MKKNSDAKKKCPTCAGQKLNELEWFTSDEAAIYLRKTPPNLRAMVQRGHIRARKFAGRLYFKRKELEELIETSFIRSTSNG